eukprot:COSAG02_NODE_25809_length_648_cov_1.260474_2_plen_94_part_01
MRESENADRIPRACVRPGYDDSRRPAPPRSGSGRRMRARTAARRPHTHAWHGARNAAAPEYERDDARRNRDRTGPAEFARAAMCLLRGADGNTA